MTDKNNYKGIVIDESRDSLMTEFGKATTHDRYQLKNESIQQMFARVAKAGSSDEQHAQRLYDYFSKHWAMPATPVLSNLGADRGLPISCFLNSVSDSLHGIFSAYTENCFLASNGGGIGSYWGNLRGIGATVKGGGKTSGIIPFLKVMDSATLAVSQGNLRRGSAAVYIDVHHPEIEEFLEIRKPTGGDQNRKALNLHHGIMVSDVFMQAVLDGTDYDLICPNKKTSIKKLNAREVWQKILTIRIETGEPYIVFSDTVNKAIPEFHKKDGLFVETSNLCLSGDTKIVTSKGLLTLSHLYNTQESFLVSSDLRTLKNAQAVCQRGSAGHIVQESDFGTGQFASSKVFLTKKDAEVFELKTKHGFKVKATKNHPFMTPNGWVELKDLSVGEDVFVQSGEGLWSTNYNLPTPTYTNHPNWNERYKKIRLDLPTVWTKEFGQIMGWMIGDGYIDNNHHWASLVFGNHEVNQIEYFKSLFGTYSDSVVLSDGGNIPHLNIMDKRFGEYLLQLGLTTNKAQHKRVPWSIMQAPREAVVGFLQGLFTADGTVNVNKKQKGCTIRLGSTSKGLLEDVQILLANFGIHGTIYHRRDASTSTFALGGEYKTQPLWDLVLGKANRKLFAEKIGFISKFKQDNVIDFDSNQTRGPYRELFQDTIVSIDYVGKEDVYDITVDESHSFIANGFVVHNCSEITLPTNEERTAVCCLSSVNLETYDEWRKDELFIPDMVEFLDNILTIFIENAPKEMSKAVFSASQERSLGLGVMGFHSYLQSKGIPFESAMAKSININSAKHIAEQAKKASVTLAERRGACPDANRHGVNVRNANVTAIAPTASISIICGNASPAMEPWVGNAFTQKTLSGSFLVKNKHLEKLLDSKNQNTKQVWKDIISHEGSVQHLEFLTEEEKEVFKTAFELDQRWIVEHASVRQQYVDQAISTNIFLRADIHKQDLHAIHMMAWKKGLKSLYYCRSKSLQQADKISKKIVREEIVEETNKYEECLGCQ